MASPFTTYKLIILYMLQNSEGDLTNSQITDFILDRKYTNYFQLQQAVSELVEADLVEMSSQSNRSYYRLTSEGKNTLKYFSKELSSDIKKEVEEYLRKILNKEAFDRSGLIYGMGHAVYTLSDPREVILKRFARDLAKEKGMM